MLTRSTRWPSSPPQWCKSARVDSQFVPGAAMVVTRSLCLVTFHFLFRTSLTETQSLPSIGRQAFRLSKKPFVGADAHIGPCKSSRFRRTAPLSVNCTAGAMWASPPTILIIRLFWQFESLPPIGRQVFYCGNKGFSLSSIGTKHSVICPEDYRWQSYCHSMAKERRHN